jgi:predicted nucleic acid-binding protein
VNVVSNTSPITNLAAIGRVDLLRLLYGSVQIPTAVFEELTSQPNQPGGAEVQSFPWISTRPVRNRTLISSLLGELDPGEAEAIALSIESQADLLLIDDRLGRRVAARLGLRFTGLIGVLFEAKQRGHVVTIKPVLDELIQQAGFWISDTLYRTICITDR